eukprot:CAMPEP_0184307336 /NCGR_PEP_ID=MMETSP1049-20130417/16109_1 /TAXON_ID=77928 /ORGANISM="Proteomonas sulcata, Strain CCMP704" /LENGTH=165 /DNA_ID=CAMNT_0026619805 /DNA_START=380 /DNA_END=877 /DNA_ORIENTATION=-
MVRVDEIFSSGLFRLHCLLFFERKDLPYLGHPINCYLEQAVTEDYERGVLHVRCQVPQLSNLSAVNVERNDISIKITNESHHVAFSILLMTPTDHLAQRIELSSSSVPVGVILLRRQVIPVLWHIASAYANQQKATLLELVHCDFEEEDTTPVLTGCPNCGKAFA